MASSAPNSHQWPHTENAYRGFNNLLMKSSQEDLEEIFLSSQTFATEKLDGTNIAKDDTGQVYSRRLELAAKDSHFLKTPLTKVREADIEMFKEKLCLAVGLEEESIERCLVYGELMCNNYYDYKDRGLKGEWRVFGACLVVQQKHAEGILQALREEDFSSEPISGNTIQILPCLRMFGVALASGLKVAPILGANKSLAQIIRENQTVMKKGRLEGIIFTIFSTKFGFCVLKWKGAHQPQTNALKHVTEAREKLEQISSNRELSLVFDILRGVLTDTEENINIQKKRIGSNKQKNAKTPSNKYLSEEDIKIILDGIDHSKTKYDCIENYERNTYLSLLKTEVRRHFIEEKNITDVFTENDSVIKFINSIVEKNTLH